MKGYKAFNGDMTNRYGKSFREGVTYTIDGKLKFGNDGNGYHICSRPEDTLRYVDAKNDDVKICEVTAIGDKVVFNDEYYGFYDMYAVSGFKIDHIFSRNELIGMFLNNTSHRVDRFLKLFPLENDEIEIFKEKYSNNVNLLKTIAYYQEHDLEVYERAYQKIKR